MCTSMSKSTMYIPQLKNTLLPYFKFFNLLLGNFGVASRVPSSISNFKMERGTSLETLAGKGLILQ